MTSKIKYQKDYTEFNETYQLVLPLSLEGLVPDDDSVRLLSHELEELDYTLLYKAYSSKGRNPAVDPKTMFKILTYAYSQNIYSSRKIENKLVAAIGENKYDFIVVNYANGDMVGHTGVYSAIEKAVVAIDACVRDTVEAAKANGYEVIIIADHGNADNAENADGTPNTAHSLNPVPFVYVTENKNARVEDGILADVAPSICHIMGLPQPAEMTGHDLLK